MSGRRKVESKKRRGVFTREFKEDGADAAGRAFGGLGV